MGTEDRERADVGSILAMGACGAFFLAYCGIGCASTGPSRQESPAYVAAKKECERETERSLSEWATSAGLALLTQQDAIEHCMKEKGWGNHPVKASPK